MNEGIITRNEGIDYLLYRNGSGSSVEIYQIQVNSGRGKGIGTDMINELKQKVKTHLIFALTRETNTLAHRFYEKNGFEVLGSIRGLYPEDARMYGYKVTNL